MYSLQHEVDLERTIRKNIDRRHGQVLPIEKRMLRSIERTFENSQVKPSEMPSKRIKNWGNATLFERAKDVGLETAYSGVFGAPSRNVHGNWHDLLQHHLEVKAPGRYLPLADSKPVRPQLPLGCAVLTVEALYEFVVHLAVREERVLLARLGDLDRRIRLADTLHEEFVSAGHQATA